MVNIGVNGTQYPVPSGPQDSNWAAKMVAFLQAVATAVNTALLGPPALVWSNTGLSFNTGWSGASLKYAKDSAGRVYWRGTATITGNPTLAAIFLSLPAGISPPVNQYFQASDQSHAGANMGIEITSAGVVVCLYPTTSTPIIDFGMISYDTHA